MLKQIPFRELNSLETREIYKIHVNDDFLWFFMKKTYIVHNNNHNQHYKI